MSSPDIHPNIPVLSKEERIKLLHQRPLVVWMTGLSGSGKSTIAGLLEESLIRQGYKCLQLDGDQVRSGLNKDLGFSEADRKENIRRIGEVCKLLCEAGWIVITSFISPFREDRRQVRNLLDAGDFFEVYVNAPLEVCESRDVKGLYKKARAGKIPLFTGIDSPYEAPLAPELEIRTDEQQPAESAGFILKAISPRIMTIQ